MYCPRPVRRRHSRAAKRIIEDDDEIDALYSDVFNDLLERLKNHPEGAHGLIHIQSAAKFLERIGDHACNLAEQVVYMVEGKDIRHPSSLESASPSSDEPGA